MRSAWFEELLPRAAASKTTTLLWILFFGLFPLAYIGGVFLEFGEESPARMMGFEDRDSSIRTAQRFAESKGFSVGGWHQYVIAESSNDLLAYYGDLTDPELQEANALAPAREVQVLFRSPDETHEFRVFLSLSGRVTGYEFGKSTGMIGNFSSDFGNVEVHTDETHHHSDDDDATMQNAMTVSDREAEAIARKALANNETLNKLVELGSADVSTDSDDSAKREVVWETHPPKHKELTLTVSISVRDSQVVAQRIKAKVDKAHRAKTRFLPGLLLSYYGSFLAFGAIYAIFRYAKRTLQKEVSHVRTLVVAGLFAASYWVLAYSIAYDQIATRVDGITFSKIGLISYVVSGLTLLIMGLLVGIGYGSGEGEIREAYPGKLTSLDALLAGRIFSRDVAASFLFGIAAAGWLLLCYRLLSRFVPSDLAAVRSDVLTFTFARIPWLTLLVGKQYDSLLMAVTGLLLPAGLLARRSKHKWRRYGWLIFFAVSAVLRNVARYPTLDGELLAAVILVCALLLPFFAYDLLAAMVSLSALAFVDELAQLTSVFPSWAGLAAWLAAFGVLTLAAATYLALRGRPVREEDVRPLYAKNLAERMSLQAEVLAAREAQLRLLPQAAPEIPGVQFAACCLPARGVGGDFYDFFPLDANRVGIFVAQGGDQGLASALCIALAKGVLMHASLQPHSPTQIITGLEASIAELLEGGSGGGISFAYGVMDTRRNVLNYARIGGSPRFVVYRDGKGLKTAAQLERMVAVPGRLPTAAPLYEGTTHAQVGDFLIFYTEGVRSLRPRRFGRREHQWVELLMRELGRQEESLQSSLVAVLSKHQNHAADDLTAVVLRVVESQTVAQEVVA